MPNPSKIKKEVKHFDAEGKILGKLATEIASCLLGKNKEVFTPGANVGDKVVVTNSAKVVVTGKKVQDKIYYRYTGFPGGIKAETLDEVMQKNPAKAIKLAVKGMLPRNKMRNRYLANLSIFPGEEK